MGLPDYEDPKWQKAREALGLHTGQPAKAKHGDVVPIPERLAGPLRLGAINFAPAPAPSALAVQVSGDHYKGLSIQPIEFIHANNIPFAEGCVIKYVSRWRAKGGVKDLEKAKHFLELLIELENKKPAQ